jgi:hypothetical protein
VEVSRNQRKQENLHSQMSNDEASFLGMVRTLQKRLGKGTNCPYKANLAM